MTNKAPSRQWVGFLSSLCLESWFLREQLYDLSIDRGLPVYVYERVHPNLVMTDDLQLPVTDELVATVGKTPFFLCILGGPRVGTPIKISGQESSTSFFEIELYQAALHRKPIRVFELPDFAPQPRLKAVLEMLRFEISPNCWTVISTNDIGRQARQILEALELMVATLPPTVPVTRRRSLLRRLVHRWWQLRGAPHELRKGDTHLSFLNEKFEVPTGDVNTALVDQLVAEASAQQDQERKLTRLWIALRELMKAPYYDKRFVDLLPSWNRVLGKWASSAAWYSLHGHLYMGCLAALKSLATVRESMRNRQAGQESRPGEEPPSGPLASAHYSIAQLLLESRGRTWHLNRAESHVNAGLAHIHGDPSNLLAIRGSIYRRQRRFLRSIADYKEVLRLREQAHEDEGRIGEAVAELGFAYLFVGRWIKGRGLIKSGVDLLKSRAEPGFLVRAMRKMYYANLLTGRLRAARMIRAEALAISENKRLLDQIR